MRTRRIRKRGQIAADVNLTPLIDTALTLLIIFMVTTPMLHNAIKIELPKGTVHEGNKQQKKLIVSVDKNGTIYFNNVQVTLESLAQKIKSHMTSAKYAQDQSVWLRVHGSTTNCNTLAAVYEKIQEVSGIKDVQIALERSGSTPKTA